MSKKVSRYRPVLLAPEITFLNSILKECYSDSLSVLPNSGGHLTDDQTVICLNLIRKLSTLETKISNDAITPAYNASALNKQEKQLADLGEELPDLEDSISLRRKKAHSKYVNIGATCCTPKEIEDATEYRYLNGFMTTEEEEAYNLNAWGNTEIATEK